MRVYLFLTIALFFSAAVQAAPLRMAKMKAKIERQYVDLTGIEPVLKIEELCTVEADVPVLDLTNEPDQSLPVDLTEMGCVTEYNRQPGSLNVGANVQIVPSDEFDLLKTVTGWIYFLPDELENPQPRDLSQLPTHTSVFSTNALDLKFLKMNLWTGGPQVCAYDGEKPICMVGNTFLVSLEIHDSFATQRFHFGRPL